MVVEIKTVVTLGRLSDVSFLDLDVGYMDVFSL